MKHFIPFFVLVVACSAPKNQQTTLIDQLSKLESISGKEEYLKSPFVAAGDRTYVVGHQDGSFPDLGWHVKDEMGGVWTHPIKLLDGYSLNISEDSGLDWCLNNANEFVNYPVGNLHRFSNQGLEVERFQFVPDRLEGAVVEFRIKNLTEDSRSLKLNFTGHIDLMPVWLSERLDWSDGKDQVSWNEASKAFIGTDDLSPWSVVLGAEEEFQPANESRCTFIRNGMGVDASLSSDLVLLPEESVSRRFFIAGSSQSKDQAQKTFQKLKNNADVLLSEKITRFQNLARTNDLRISDEGLNQMFRWIKYNTDWLIQEVSDQGRGVTAGIPDYPWWFGTDGAYILQGLASAGMHEEALSTIDLIMKLSKDVNGSTGQIMHEASTNGVVFNPGNLNTTPTFINALWKTYAWTGDDRILEYYEDVKKGMEWIESQDEDGNGYPDGAGMMEIHGLHSEMIDVVAYQYQAYLAAANFAEVMNELNLAKEYEVKAELLKSKINSDWWVEEFSSYADFRSSKREAIELIQASIVRADTINKPWSVEELKQTHAKVKSQNQEGLNGYVVHHNWVVNTPMEVGAADVEKADLALETARNYTNRFGIFVTGIDRDENQEKAEKWKAFSYVGAVMTLPTGVQAISEARYGNSDRSLDYLKMLESSFSYAFPGSMYEVSPDFGMIAQGWNIYAVAVPVVDHFFGVEPLSHKKEIMISPDIPEAWSKGSLNNIKIGDNYVSISFERDANEIGFTIEQSKDWTIRFKFKGQEINFSEQSKSLTRPVAQ